MEFLFLFLLAVGLLGAAIAVHRFLPGLTPGRGQLWAARSILLVVGVGFGWTMVQVTRHFGFPDGLATSALVFLAAFGLVHLPAFFIALIKRERRRQGAGPEGPPPSPWRNHGPRD